MLGFFKNPEKTGFHQIFKTSHGGAEFGRTPDKETTPAALVIWPKTYFNYGWSSAEIGTAKILSTRKVPKKCVRRSRALSLVKMT